jgi:hypothetical protein
MDFAERSAAGETARNGLMGGLLEANQRLPRPPYQSAATFVIGQVAESVSFAALRERAVLIALFCALSLLALRILVLLLIILLSASTIAVLRFLVVASAVHVLRQPRLSPCCRTTPSGSSSTSKRYGSEHS